jgi:hypothetical protein
MPTGRDRDKRSRRHDRWRGNDRVIHFEFGFVIYGTDLWD